MAERVCAVLVTFNRKSLLRVCLNSLLQQTRPVDEILIVDNASSDGTPELLREEFPQLPSLRLDSNTGGAGGFAAGMKRAYDEGFNWIWVMDDDIEMVPTALQGLLSFSDVGDLITPCKMHPNGLLIWEAIWNPAACSPLTLTRNKSFANGKRWTLVAFSNFEGALIRRNVIERSGLPDPRYFIGGDDSMYGLRAHFHARVIYADTLAVVKHLHSQTPRSKLGFYPQIRNRFLNFEHFRDLKSRSHPSSCSTTSKMRYVI